MMMVEKPWPQPKSATCALLQLVDDALQRRKPGRHEVRLIAGTEGFACRTEQALRLVAPADALARAKGRLDERLTFQHRDRQIEGGQQIDGAVRVGEHHRLLFRQRELARGGIVFQISGRRLMRQPLARIALGHPAFHRKLCGCHRGTF
jgi:hypothetical protein